MNHAPKNLLPVEPCHTILDNMSTALLMLDDDLNLLHMNPAAESLLDVSGRLSAGLSFDQLVRGGEEITKVLREALLSNQSYTARKASFNLLANGEITVDYTITPIGQHQADAILLEIYPLSRYLRIDRDALLRTHQETTRQMIRGLAHEIKNPLGGIRGAAQLLTKELKNADLSDFTNIIIDETDRLVNLLDRMLGPNTLPRPVKTNIHQLLEKTSTLINAESHGRIEIIKDYDPSIPEFYLDEDLMLQAILNIARNAMQSLQDTPNPQLTFSTRTERQFTIGSIRHRLVLKMSIQDNGPGIAEELKEQLFFPMISGRADGTGLGLPLAQSIIHQHDGLIEFESEPGHTDFTTIIPLKSEMESQT